MRLKLYDRAGYVADMLLPAEWTEWQLIQTLIASDHLSADQRHKVYVRYAYDVVKVVDINGRTILRLELDEALEVKYAS